MKRYNLLVFGFGAGMLLLAPSLVGAHSATGVCANCHTMHNSQNNQMENPAGPQEHLLKLSCIGCHALRDNGADGRASTGIAAPQVFPLIIPPAVAISGGYFNKDGGVFDANTHNVADIAALPDQIILANTATSPGGLFPLVNGAVPALTCVGCHDPAIGHSAAGSARTGTSTSSYRMLHSGTQYVVGTGDVDFEAGGGRNVYNASSMNLFCATCHGTFHSLANTDSNGDGTGVWIRHPTDVRTDNYSDNYGGADKVVPIGTLLGTGIVEAGGVSRVMCISCHRPHGNANPDMLRFGYDATNNAAGDGVKSVGCETCHGMM